MGSRGLYWRLASAAVVIAVAGGGCSSAQRSTLATSEPSETLDASEFTAAPTTETPSPSEGPEKAGSSSTGGRAAPGTGGSDGGSAGTPAETPRQRVFCPSGSVSASVDSVSSGEDEPGSFDVDVVGSVTNNTSRIVSNISISVVIVIEEEGGGHDTRTRTAFFGASLAPGSSGTWRADTHVRSEDEPNDNDVSAHASDWSWGQGFEDCPR